MRLTLKIDIGTNILVAGLSFQVASLFAFLVCSADFLLRVRKRKDERRFENAELYKGKRFKLFLICKFSNLSVTLGQAKKYSTWICHTLPLRPNRFSICRTE